MSGVLHGVLASLKAAAAAVTDAYFKYVSLLLNTSSTNGAQNNTFLDSSTNAFSVTRNGNTTQGNFSPFSQTGWSNYFDGTGDELNAGSNAAFSFGTGAYTVEAWVYLTAAVSATHQPMFVCNHTTNGFTFWNENTVGQLQIASSGIGAVLSSATTLSPNIWNHIVAVRSGTGANQTAIFVNGTRVANGTDATNWSITGPLKVGGITTTNYYLTGYASNVRVVKGSAVYDPTQTTLTVPTSPLTAITNTSLLTCQSNRFIDNSSNAFAITRNGDVSVQAFSPFNPTAAWSASTNGGSGYFDGTGDYLSVADNVALEPGTGDFCLEAWVYFNALGIGNIYNAQQSGPSISLNASNQIEFGQSYVLVLLTDTVAATTGQWYHIAVCRSGTSLSMFVNGSRRATATNSTNFNTTVANYIGWNGASAYFNGYLSNLRLVKGSAVYDPTLTTLTVPTAPLTAITNTSLLLNFTNAGIYDSASGNDLETVGNAQVSTTQAKWGTTSLSFDGAGDLLVAPNNVSANLSSGDFTIEFWFNANSTAVTGALVAKMNYSAPNWTGYGVFQVNQTIVFYHANSGAISNISTGNVITSTGTWYHIAVVRSGTAANNTKIYIDGVQQAQGTPTIGNVTRPLTVGGSSATYGWDTDRFINGYIDDLRITNGYARYTANFTPPTAAFPLN